MVNVSIVAMIHIEVDDYHSDGFKWNDQHLGKKIVRCEDWGENIGSSALCVYPHCKVSIGQYTKMCTSPLIFSSTIISDDKYLKKIFDHFHFHCIFDHLSHEQS